MVGINETLAKFGVALGGQAAEGSTEAAASVKTLTQFIGFSVQIAVVMVASVQALQKLGLTIWVDLVNHVLAFAVTKGVVALLIVTAGLQVQTLFATSYKLAFRMIRAALGSAKPPGLVFSFLP